MKKLVSNAKPEAKRKRKKKKEKGGKEEEGKKNSTRDTEYTDRVVKVSENRSFHKLPSTPMQVKPAIITSVDGCLL